MYDKSKQYFSNISWVGAESAPTFTIWGRKAPPYIINDFLFGFYLRKKDYTKAEKYLDYFSEYDPMKSYYQGRLLQKQGKM